MSKGISEKQTENPITPSSLLEHISTISDVIVIKIISEDLLAIIH